MVRTLWKSCISPLQQNRTENNFLTRVYHGLDTVEILYQPTATEQNRKQFPNQGLPWSGHISPTEQNIRIFLGCEVRIEKSVRGSLFRTTKLCQTVIPRDGFFYLHRTTMIDFFSCIPFDLKRLILT